MKVEHIKSTHHLDKGTAVPTITVWGVDRGWEYRKDKPKLCQSRGTIGYPNRMVVVPPAALTPEYQELLAPVHADSTKKSLGIK